MKDIKLKELKEQLISKKYNTRIKINENKLFKNTIKPLLAIKYNKCK